MTLNYSHECASDARFSVTESDEGRVVSFAATPATVFAWTDSLHPCTCAFNLLLFPGHADFSSEMVLLAAFPMVL